MVYRPWLQWQQQPSKERTKVHSNQKLKNTFRNKLPSEKNLPFDLRIITIISVRLKSKSFCEKKFMVISKKV